MKPKQKSFLQNLDWVTTILPFGCITLLCCLFMIFPEGSANILASIRFFLGDQLGSYYLLMGLGAVICSLYMAFSRFGSIKLGDVEKPQYTAFQWGSMMFTAGLAADILFYSLCEWMLYADESHISEMGSIQDWTSVYPLFHWGPIPWSFYIILAVAFGFMIHVRRRNKQKYSEACRPLLGKKVDGVVGKLIDLTAVFALLAGTATTFSLGYPSFIHGFKQGVRSCRDAPSYHCYFSDHLYCIHTGCIFWHAGSHTAGCFLYLSVFCAVSLLPVFRRSDTLHH